MEDDFLLEFTPEINEDIPQQKICKTSIDFIINYEDGILTKEELKQALNVFVSDEYYNYAESVSRALKSIDIIFK